MRIGIVVLLLLLVGCKSPKKDYDFTFFKWNIHESYYLKFNSLSDTLYCVDSYGFKEETSFAILNKDQKERIQNILDAITFPKKDTFESQVDDGETNAFVLKKGEEFKKLKIHGKSGPVQFWLFGKTLERIKLNLQFIKANKKVDLKEINKMVIMKMPPTFVVDTLQ